MQFYYGYHFQGWLLIRLLNRVLERMLIMIHRDLVFQFLDYRLHCNEMLMKNGEIIAIPPKELRALSCLVANSKKIIKKDDIVAYVWQGGEVKDESVVRCIYSLRKLFKQENLIITIYGRGYCFNGDVKLIDSGAKNDYLYEIPNHEKRQSGHYMQSIGRILPVFKEGICSSNSIKDSFQRLTLNIKCK